MPRTVPGLEGQVSLEEKHLELEFPRYKARWPDKTWDLALAKADVLEKRDRGMLWCKVPKAASESWTGLFIKQWYGRKAKQLMWRQQVHRHHVSNPQKGFDLRCSSTRRGRHIGGRRPTSRPSPALTSLSSQAGSYPFTSSPTYLYLMQASIRKASLCLPGQVLPEWRCKVGDNLCFRMMFCRFEKDKAERWYNWYGKAILTGYRNERPPETKYERAPTFKEFIRYLVELPLGI